MEKWVVTAKRADFNRIAQTYHIDPVTARIIRNRDVVDEAEIESYLNGDLSMLNDPGSMKDIEKAASLLQEKTAQKKKIRIIGDYDIDGIQSTYILFKALKRCGALADYIIPDRMGDGYGLNARLITQAAEDGVDTILTCDNGIAAVEEIRLGKELGLTVIVTDHHEVPYEEDENGVRTYRCPAADAVVNPKQQDCAYPFKSLCGAAVAYKLVQVLYRKIGIKEEELQDFLQYAAFATVGDVMDLVGENRIIVKEGLKRLNRTTNKGLRALMSQNGLEPGDIKAYHIGFILGPCLNASGRLDTAMRALSLLQAKDEEEAVTLAKDLTDLNISRKEMTAAGVEEASRLAEEAVREGDKVLVLYLPQCHESLAGIVAGRVREKYHRPAFVLTKAEEGVKGSGRSIEVYSMFEEMSRCKELFTRYGGHPMAAGLSLPEENVAVFRRRLNELTTLTEEDLIPKVKIDVPMPISYITSDLVEELSVLEPFGKGNEKPVFADRNLKVLSSRILGKNKNVMKMQVAGADGVTMEAMYFGEVEKLSECLLQEKEMSFVYYPEINRFGGRETLQIVVKNYC